MRPPEIIREPIPREHWMQHVSEGYGDMVKVVVNVASGLLGLGGEMHIDAEQLLLENGSRQEDLWGANVYPHEDGGRHLEFDSMINLKPRQNNRSNTIQDPTVRAEVESLTTRLLL